MPRKFHSGISFSSSHRHIYQNVQVQRTQQWTCHQWAEHRVAQAILYALPREIWGGERGQQSRQEEQLQHPANGVQGTFLLHLSEFKMLL